MFDWISFITYAVITAVTPGPNNLMSMSNAGRVGFRRALPFNFGILAGFGLVMLLCTWLSSTLHSILPRIERPMLIVGAAYLLYLAYKTLRSSTQLEEGSGKSGFLSGLLLQFVNPKIYLYCIISMEAYVLPFYQDQALWLIFFALLLAVIGFLFTLCWSAFGSLFRLLFSKHAKRTNAIMALLLVYCAISLFL